MAIISLTETRPATLTHERAVQLGAKGGRATVRKHGIAHMAAIGRKGWYGLVTKRFGGDYQRAGAWLSRHGLRAQDPFPENGAWQTVPPMDPRPAGQPGPTYTAKIPWYIEERYAAARARLYPHPLTDDLDALEL
jgi:hypothetical protein